MSENPNHHIKAKIYGNNHLCCKNLGITGKKFYHMIYAFVLYSLPYITWLLILIHERSNIKINFPIIISSILYFFQIYSEMMGGLSDPGILPRQRKDFYYHTNRQSLKYVINGHLCTLAIHVHYFAPRKRVKVLYVIIALRDSIIIVYG